ncbi:MAG: hypothetical protein GDA56_25765 [Hormoscilla sp. GM7CHS1pb]|nr:hypothetical protein [Hormoscilla sp. GM7CHS1pb]
MPPKKTKKINVRRQGSSSEIKRLGVEIPKVSFDFMYYQDDKENFSIRGRDVRYLEVLLRRLRDLSKLTVQEIVNNRSKSRRCHPIDWQDTTEPNGFGLPNEDKVVVTAYQFQISANEHGRVHGFFRDNVFYIVWLDPDHNLYR